MHGKRTRRGPRNAGRQSPDEVEEAPQAAAVGVVQDDDDNVQQTPTKKMCLDVANDAEQQVRVVQNAAAAVTEGRVVTPASTTTTTKTTTAASTADPTAVPAARRALFTTTAASATAVATPITPSRHDTAPPSPAKRRLMFGRLVTEVHVQQNVRQVYKIVKRLTGSLGGNGSEGPIYGELTMHSMQKMVNLMKQHTGFCSTSRFIDVGSGIGKPSLHVTQDPGVTFSYGIEVEESRWLLGMSCLKGMLEAAVTQDVGGESSSSSLGPEERIRHECVFEKGDIRQAKIFDPFTHVYMFSIGFPPVLWIELAKIWNRSSSPYLICYHGPKDIIDTYEFDVELIAQKQTSMHGSKEGHMGYIYRRKSGRKFNEEACDPVFKAAFEKVKLGANELRLDVEQEVGRLQGTGPFTRARRSHSS